MSDRAWARGGARRGAPRGDRVARRPPASLESTIATWVDTDRLHRPAPGALVVGTPKT